DAALAGERARRHRLPAAVDRGPEVAPGEPSVLHLEARAEDVRDAELARNRLDLVAGGRGDDGERVAATPVGLHQRARLGVDRAGQVGVERHTKASWKIPPPGAGGRGAAGFPPGAGLG